MVNPVTLFNFVVLWFVAYVTATLVGHVIVEPEPDDIDRHATINSIAVVVACVVALVCG